MATVASTCMCRSQKRDILDGIFWFHLQQFGNEMSGLFHAVLVAPYPTRDAVDWCGTASRECVTNRLLDDAREDLCLFEDSILQNCYQRIRIIPNQ